MSKINHESFNQSKKIIFKAISCCTFVCILMFIFISTVEAVVDYDFIVVGTSTQSYKTSNADKELIPSGMIRIFVNKNRLKSIVVHKQDCSVMRSETNTYGFGFKVGGLVYDMGPEIFYRYSSGVNWSGGVQLIVAEFQELCTRFNTGRLSQEEYSEEVYEIINRNKNYLKELDIRLKNKKDSLFKELDEWEIEMPR